MLQRGSAKRPQRVLQTFCQRDKALPTEHDMRMLPARKGQPEVVEPVIQRHTGDADAVIGHIGEIRQSEPTRRMVLPKDDVLLGPVEGPPAADAPLQGPADPATDLGVTAPDLVENGYRPQARRALQQRHHLAVPNRSQRVRSSADARRFLLRGEPWILFYAIGGGSTEPGFGRGNRRRLGLAKTHVQPHLAIGDVAAGQAAILIGIKDPLPIRPAVTARKHGPERGRACRQIRDCSRATPSLRHASGDTFSSCLPRSKRRRFGYRRLWVLLRREGHTVNRKRVYRLYKQERLMVRRRGGCRRAIGVRSPMPLPLGPNQRWSLDFVHDQMTDGRRLRIRAVVDDYTRECLVLVADTSISGVRVAHELDKIIAVRGRPGGIVSDNGTELTSTAILAWSDRHKIGITSPQ